VFTHFAAATGYRKIHPVSGKLMFLDAQDILACPAGHLTLFA
jgi:hypothetical protein